MGRSGGPAGTVTGRGIVKRMLGLAGRARRRWLPRPLDRIVEVPGWTQEVQLRYLMRRVRGLSDGSRVVELGVWQGRSALALAEACRGTTKRVFAIDPWQDYDEGGGPVSGFLARRGAASFEQAYEAFGAYCRALALEPWIVTLRQPSLEAARSWSHGPIALLFIDANHHYDAVTADLEAWIGHLETRGLVCGDDWNWDSVRSAVSDFAARHRGYRIEQPCDNTWELVKVER